MGQHSRKASMGRVHGSRTLETLIARVTTNPRPFVVDRGVVTRVDVSRKPERGQVIRPTRPPRII